MGVSFFFFSFFFSFFCILLILLFAESLLPFACLVLIAYSTGRVGEWSALGAQVFLVSRVAYALFYIGGVKVLRTLAYFGGIAGMVMVVVQVF